VNGNVGKTEMASRHFGAEFGTEKGTVIIYENDVGGIENLSPLRRA